MATARHPKATYFVQRNLFSGLTTFAELERRIAALPEEKDRGDAFEVFAEAYLVTQRKYDAAQVWPHGSIPLDILKKQQTELEKRGVWMNERERWEQGIEQWAAPKGFVPPRYRNPAN